MLDTLRKWILPEIASVEAAPTWAPECYAFLEHWSALRGEDLMPTTEAFLDKFLVQFAPSVYILELCDDTAIVRLQGTSFWERWGNDLTGHSIFGGPMEAFTARGMEDLQHVLNQPCGLMTRFSYETSRARMITSDLIHLPLATRGGRPPRVAAFASRNIARDPQERPVTPVLNSTAEWVDLGRGVPDRAPYRLSP